MPSGKQILLQVLRDLSQGNAPSPISPEIQDRVRAAFLLHGSTASESWLAVHGIEWATETDSEERATRQGLAHNGVFLSDLFEQLTYPEDIPPHITAKFPSLTPQGYREAIHFIWLILTSVQWFDCLRTVEDESADTAQGEFLLANYIQKLHHFRKHPGDFN